jgi:glycosyltransferase involved in cell wall biosynthesis
MAHGLPIVATRLAGIVEAVDDGDTGILVEPDQPGPLAEALAQVLEDRRLASRLGTAALKAVRERFDRRRTLPEVWAALTEAGIVTPRVPVAVPDYVASARAA